MRTTSYKLLYLLFLLAISGTVIILKVNNIHRRTTFPSITLKDIHGDLINKSYFRKSILFVQYVDERQSGTQHFFMNLVQEWKNTALIILVITNNIDALKKYAFEYPKNIKIVSGSTYDFKSFFNSSPNIWRIYKNNKLYRSGMIERGYDFAKVALNNIVLNIEYHSDYFIKRNENIHEIPWLDQLCTSLSNKKLLVGFFISLCDVCGTGNYINILNKYKDVYADRLNFIIITYTQYNYKEINNLKRQIGTNIDIVRSEAGLFSKWSELISIYGSSDLNNIIALFDEEGKILFVVDHKCNCFREFEKQLFKLLQSGN